MFSPFHKCWSQTQDVNTSIKQLGVHAPKCPLGFITAGDMSFVIVWSWLWSIDFGYKCTEGVIAPLFVSRPAFLRGTCSRVCLSRWWVFTPRPPTSFSPPPTSGQIQKCAPDVGLLKGTSAASWSALSSAMELQAFLSYIILPQALLSSSDIEQTEGSLKLLSHRNT